MEYSVAINKTEDNLCELIWRELQNALLRERSSDVQQNIWCATLCITRGEKAYTHTHTHTHTQTHFESAK